PNAFVELPIFTHLPLSGDHGQESLSRNHINVLSCQAVVALPGQAGTASEVALALHYGRRVIAYARDDESVGSFPAVVPRAGSLEELRRFLSTAVAGSPSAAAQGAGSSAATASLRPIGPVIETALYVEDLDRSQEFYRRVLDLRLASDPISRLCALAIGADEV